MIRELFISILIVGIVELPSAILNSNRIQITGEISIRDLDSKVGCEESNFRQFF